MLLTEEEIKQKIKNSEIKAISVDTSILRKKSYAFDSEPLAALEQFNDSHIYFIVSEIVLNEARKHLVLRKYEIYKSFISNLRKMILEWELANKVEEEIENKICFGRSASDVVDCIIDRFSTSTAFEVLKVSDYCNFDTIVDSYFKEKPPFSSKKKSEFPDALALYSLEGWAKKNNTIVLTISDDNDWVNFCTNSEFLVSMDSLDKALELFQDEMAGVICRKIAKGFDREEYPHAEKEIEKAIEKAVLATEFTVEINAMPLHMKLSSADVELTIVDIKPYGDFHELIPVNYDGRKITLQLLASVELAVTYTVQGGGELVNWSLPLVSSNTTTVYEHKDIDIYVKFSRVSGDLWEFEDVERPYFNRHITVSS